MNRAAGCIVILAVTAVFLAAAALARRRAEREAARRAPGHPRDGEGMLTQDDWDALDEVTRSFWDAPAPEPRYGDRRQP